VITTLEMRERKMWDLRDTLLITSRLSLSESIFSGVIL